MNCVIAVNVRHCSSLFGVFISSVAAVVITRQGTASTSLMASATRTPRRCTTRQRASQLSVVTS